MNFEKLTDKQKEEFGKPIPGSRFVRDFCCDCSEPIRVPVSKLLDDNVCSNCNDHITERRRYLCDIEHTKDYDNPDIDSGFDDIYDSDSTDKKIDPNNFPDEI